MNTHLQHLENLREIRSIMDRSSRFLSLSGLSGVAAGVCALLGAGVVKWYLGSHYLLSRSFYQTTPNWDTIFFLGAVAAVVLVLALGSGIYFTQRKARQNRQTIWDSQAKRLLLNLALPLVAGGIFCGALLYHGLVYLIAPAMLIFYGLALLNASKYTLRDIRFLGLSEIGLGLVACFFIGYGLLSWTIGFGLLHILYGTIMYVKYEREAPAHT
ncbi:hypothetical protein ACFSC6_00200 [Rufibacter sediminis]|uniref:Uncharacterized protein n=1 Tax=Rufibacter sediminis TaxID=2762756 RepID=A0ABR6VM34_9BACT|nr:hypothetical protein [Rufibacter sediminis]MBC3538228.1 hypothetical protein [Rufibacter sediminis]